jgi:hypothetical protein
VPCIVFEFDKSDLITSEIPFLVDLAKVLNDNPSYELIIYGHTDSYGTDSYNMILSRKRAEAARSYLLNKGVQNRITVQPCGESQPVADNGTETGRQMNRRVCFELIKKESGNINGIRRNHVQIITGFYLAPKPPPTSIKNNDSYTEPLIVAQSMRTDRKNQPGRRKRHLHSRSYHLNFAVHSV